MPSFRRLPLLAALLCGACSTTPGIKLVATPSPLAGDGLTKATATATVTEGGSPTQGATVHFKTTLGSFDGANPGTPLQVDVTTSENGIAVATFTAPRQGWGTIGITASVSLQGKEPSAKVDLPLQPSGGEAASISFTCTSHNVGALVFNRHTDIHMLCRATALDVANHPIKNASVQTLTEAGSLDWLDDSGGVQEFVYTVRPDDNPPEPVDPLGSDGKPQEVCPSTCNGDPFASICQGEPCWTDQAGVTHNPRDGVATLVAAVPAVEGFDNQGEPFVDKNDNGVHDPDEPYIDYNGNGKYDAADGTKKKRLVWKVFHVIWTGEAAAPPTGQGTHHDSFMTVDKPNHALTAHFVDRNLNALAAVGSAGADAIEWTVGSCTGDASLILTTDAVAMDQTNPGILFTAGTDAISAPGNRGTYTRNTDYGNTYALSGTGTCPVTAAPARTYDPGAPGFEPTGANPDNGVLAVVGP